MSTAIFLPLQDLLLTSISKRNAKKKKKKVCNWFSSVTIEVGQGEGTVGLG